MPCCDGLQLLLWFLLLLLLLVYKRSHYPLLPTLHALLHSTIAAATQTAANSTKIAAALLSCLPNGYTSSTCTQQIVTTAV
jgi:hypothetical protein